MLRVLTGGESHGPSLSAMVEGLPAGLEVDLDTINAELRRRQAGHGRGGRQQIESDEAEVLTGVRFGRTLGSPVTLLVRNRDFENWRDRMAVEPSVAPPPPIEEARPGHADFSGMLKYSTDDLRDVLERSSARGTAMLVAVGAVCRQLLAQIGVRVFSHVTVIGGVAVPRAEAPDYGALAEAAETSPVRMGYPDAEKDAMRAIDQAAEAGDTLGGVFEVAALGCPPGLGSHVHWDRRLDGRLAGALMGIQAIKGVEVGMGFDVARRPGSEVHDEIVHVPGTGFRRATNNAGGVEGGMTNGEPVVVRAAMKPLSTLKRPLRSVNMRSKEAVQAHYERSDVCAVPAAAVIGEAMVCMVLAEAVLEKFGGDSVAELKRNHASYMAEVRRRCESPN
ncbi:MAG TPA: chorismate synthase [Chthonomonadales bacterium]|nr:chorismate synthase [Chthonomonadales bacterium]